jgi:hypothetical protein
VCHKLRQRGIQLTELITTSSILSIAPEWMPWEVLDVLHSPLSYHAPVVVCGYCTDVSTFFSYFRQVMQLPKRIYCHNSSERCSKQHNACNIHGVRLTRKQLWQVVDHQAMRIDGMWYHCNQWLIPPGAVIQVEPLCAVR